MQPDINEPACALSQTDWDELAKLVNVLELSSGTKIIFAIAPESGPQHPVVQQLRSLLQTSDEEFQFHDFFYSDNSLYNFIYGSDNADQQIPQSGRKLVMAFGIDQLPTPRMVRELKQLNLGREVLFSRELVLIFWLNKVEFLDEFRNRAPDFWDWRGKVVQFEARPVFNPLFYPYLEWLIAENSYLKMSGVMQVQRQVDIFLDQIYVSLQAVRRQQVTETSEGSQRELEMAASRQVEHSHRLSISSSSLDGLDEPCDYEPVVLDPVSVSTSTKTVTQKVNLSQAVRENQYCVILGAPGAGKTTLLRYLARHFAVAKRDGTEIVLGGEAQEELGKPLLPVFFRIADYAERLDEQPDLILLDYLRQFYRQWEAYFKDEAEAEGGTEVAALLLEQMRHGQCLILLDGLDEVFDQESRRRIVERINQFVEVYSANKFVVTSRIAGYRDVKLSESFAEFTIEDMGSEQVEKFLYRWCQAIERAQQPDASEEQWQRAGDAQTREILEAIKANEGVKRLTANPLLLTILALIHRNGSRLPNRRVELYALAVKTLTEDWQLGKNLPDAPKVVLKESEVVELLAPLAYWMHEEKPSGLVTQAEVEERLAVTLTELNDAEPESDSVRQAVQQFLRKVRETTGLFVERAPGVYGFMHLTFEEYFAARYIADNERSEILHLIREHMHEPRWDEPILLALGYYGSHSRKQVSKLLEQLFNHLEAYKPALEGGEIKIKNASSPDAVLIWSALQGESETTCSQSELRLKDLLFAGQVIAQVEVNSSIRKKLIQKLVLTYLVLDADFEDDTTKQLLRLLRQIELFNQKGEVIAQLKQAASSSTLSEEMRIKAQSAILYIACSEPGTGLINCVTEMANQLEPSLFCCIKNLMAELGEEMTPALETTRQNQGSDQESQTALSLLTGMSYIRTDNYEKAIELFEEINHRQSSSLSAYIAWSLATCYQKKSEFKRAIDYYQKCFQKLARCIEPMAFLFFWRNRGICQRLHSQYEEAIDCFQKMLTITRKTHKFKEEANCLWHIGKTYKDWGKYKEAVAYYQESQKLYKQLGREENVGNLWYWLADCYQNWGKYEQALEYELRELEVRQKLEEQPDIALAFYRLGLIYQAWGKYEQAIEYYQQSRDLYEQLGRDKDVANQWCNLADCYKDWGKYEQAVEYQQKGLTLRQQREDKSRVALSYYQLGRTYQAWGKYEQALAYYQQSRELYEQLGRDKDVANLWYWLADCYRDWGKHQQALESQQQCLRIRQTLDDQSLVAVTYYQLGRIYKAWGKYEQALAHYQQSRDLYEQLGREKNVASQWNNLADCYKDWGKYEQAVEGQQQCLRIRQTLDDQSLVAVSYYQLGRIYQAWGEYEQALAYYQQSRDLYEQLGRDKNVANQWYWLGNCYRNWGKYEQAVECELKDLAIRQKLDDKTNIADAYKQLGRIYQAWGKYERAIAHYQQSRELYEQLAKHKDVANQWNHLADCYCDWGKYEKAIESQQQCLTIRQTLDNQSLIAVTYHQLCQIYQAWGKYEQAITQCQRSLDLYEELGREKDLTIQLFYMAICYLARGKYEQALEYQQRSLLLGQKQEDQLWIALNYSLSSVIHKTWGKYEQAIIHCQQSSELYEQLGRAQNLAQNWRWLADCYCDWGKYERAVQCELKNLAIRQQLDNQPNIADAYHELGRIYQDWGKYEQAIAHYQQSLDLYEQLDLQKNVANRLNNLANCYRDLKNYTKAIEYYQQSRDLHQQLGQDISLAILCRQIGNTQRLLAKNTPDTAEASNLLAQAEQNIRQAIQLDTAGDYKENLAYDYTTLGLLYSERLRLLPADDSSLPEQIAQFEDYYNTGLTYLTELGQTVYRAEETLDMARAYLEINALENLNRAEVLTQESLQIFQDYNRRKLEAAAHKLLGEIYLKRTQRNQPNAEAIAHQFLSESLQLYRELDLTEKASEVEQLMHPNPANSERE